MFTGNTIERSTTAGLDIKVTTDLVTEPVTSVEMKNYLRVDYSLDDTLITMMIKSARKMLEKFTGCSFGSKTIIATYNSVAEIIEIPYGPLISMTTVKKIDRDGVKTTLTVNDDFILIGEEFKKIKIFQPVGYGFEFTYTAGFATLPDDLKIAIMNQVAYNYENRGDDAGKMTANARSLARQYKRNIWSI